ncbi:hypothetical protein FDUTEX481_04989 [Tolypothrix sp. PCC 7601]|nr:hypothetical protein FDUTEX481_04989 [Tolypothrix sp. PCC 7601]
MDVDSESIINPAGIQNSKFKITILILKLGGCTLFLSQQSTINSQQN